METPSPSETVEDEQLLDDSALANIPTNVLTVHNVLASGSLACNERLDLDKCCMVLGNSYYSPAEFPALRVDVRGERSALFTISLFESGRIQSTGGCRPIEAKKAMIKIGRRLRQKLGYAITFQNFEIQNILAVYDAGFPVSLPHFSASFHGHVYYEPDRFPAARVRIPVPARTQLKKEGDEMKKEEDQTEQRVSAKLRKLMIGDASPASEVSGGVGSYMITATARRPVTTRQRQEKMPKEETVTANVFSTGKITFTGAKSIASLNYALTKLKPVIGVPGADHGVPLSLDGSLLPPTNLNPDLRARIARLQQQEATTTPPYMFPYHPPPPSTFLVPPPTGVSSFVPPATYLQELQQVTGSPAPSLPLEDAANNGRPSLPLSSGFFTGTHISRALS